MDDITEETDMDTIMTQRYPLATLVLFLLLFGVLENAPAQLRTTVTILSSFDDNAFRNSLEQAENITSMALSLEYQPGDANVRLFYGGNANLFRQYAARQYFSNSLGASYLRPFGGDDENSWNISATYYVRSNKDQFNYYDFNQTVGTASVKYYLNSEAGLLSRAGYRLRYRSYANLDEFTYLENYGYASLSKFFETKTTAIVELALGNKRYVSAITTSATTSASTNGGSGWMGEHGGMGSGWGDDQTMVSWMNDGMTPGSRVVSYSSPSTTQMIGTLRVAQSLSPTTGASLQFLRRWDMSERTRFLSSGAVDFQGDEELWDDPYGYQSYEYSAAVTQVLPWGMSVRASVDYLTKDYARRVFLASETDVPTGPLRADTRVVGGVDVKQSFENGWLMFDSITLSMTYLFIQNTSNDEYYNFRSNAFAFGFSVDL